MTGIRKPAWAGTSRRAHESDCANWVFCGKIYADGPLANLDATQQERARRIVSPLDPDTAQQVLDDWGQAIKTNSIKKSKWAWLESVTRRAQAGAFTPTTDAADRRQAEKRLKTALQATPPQPLWSNPCPRPKIAPNRVQRAYRRCFRRCPRSWRGRRNERSEPERRAMTVLVRLAADAVALLQGVEPGQI